MRAEVGVSGKSIVKVALLLDCNRQMYLHSIPMFEHHKCLQSQKLPILGMTKALGVFESSSWSFWYFIHSKLSKDDLTCKWSYILKAYCGLHP